MEQRVRKSGSSFHSAPDLRGETTALALLRAAPFRILQSKDLQFASSDGAADVLYMVPNKVPQTQAEWTSRLSPDAARERRRAMSRLTWDGAEYKVTYQWRGAHGDNIWIEEQGRRISGDGANPSEIQGVIRNITQQKHAQDRAAFLASHDELTGLPNLAALTQSLDHMGALGERQQSQGALLRLSLNNLADINDIYGYHTGDTVLQALAKRLSNIMRPPDLLGRIGGGDFALVLYGATAQEVKAIAERLFVLLEKSSVNTPHGPLFFAVSIASTQMPSQAKTAQAALAQTQAALQHAQPSKLCRYDNNMAANTATAARETSAQDVLDALNQRRIQLAYQPIIDAKSSRLHHYECLLRLKREDGELVSAGKFIMAAEGLGLVHMLDRRALELAAETLKSDPDIKLALNVSAATVTDPAAASAYITALKALGPRADQATIELTETVALDDPAKASEFSNHVRLLGCQFSIDDFGAGYTTFQNLLAIEADSIKIDGSFIQGVASDVSKQTFVRMMVDLAQTFGVETVAEMVDDRADAQVLRRLGIDYFQGYMFGMPSAVPSWQN